MPSNREHLSGYRPVWLVALFDLPVTTAKDRRNYMRFRKTLLKAGFAMLQFSVYARYCASDEAATSYRQRVKVEIPPEGEVRLLSVTDRQFGRMEVYLGKKRGAAESAPKQMHLF